MELAHKPGDELEVQGDFWNTLGVIKVGQVKGSRANALNKSKAVVFLGRGRPVGLGSAFGHRSQLTLVAITSVRVCCMDANLVRTLAMPDAEFRKALQDTAGSFVNCLTDWSRVLREDEFALKLYYALHLIATEGRSASFTMPSHAELADLLGSRRETIGRHLTAMVGEGRLERRDRRHFVLVSDVAIPSSAG
ncbi:MAG TPA: Crp/Fnr family transcriptional regulator [Hydrogenophaga sp.]|uniref:Crp/Fnr family transcriptional regulator n=1 Tax=Hydrogenophaga sp. TaxID=1904254 RepID=UPI002CBDDC81|nr:Crp/Fnr family transcriptional regulator [Hydrogenophaga sp.]HMN94119.1 Crp/Fnr family transcriptional regulator [Hydrogenophaga sp.]HMP09067.1 Crp/Fnr family transcriptional regulator [Hydrogenophaga sp.]